MKSFRIIAAVGIAAHLVIGLVRSLNFRSEQWPLVLLGVAVLVAGSVMVLLVAKRSLGKVVSQPDLFVPIGIYVALQDLFMWSATAPVLSGFFKPLFSFSWSHVAYAFSAGSILQFLVNTTWVGWAVSLLLQVLAEQRVDLLQPFRTFAAWLWRVALVRVIGSIATSIFIALGFSLMVAFSKWGIGGGFLAALILLPAMIAFNLAFAFVVPAGLQRREPVFKAIWSALLFGMRSWRRTLFPIVAFSVLVGSVPLIIFSSTSGPSSFNMRFNLYWLTDFPGSCTWETLVANLRGVPTIPLVSNLLRLFLLSVSMVVILEIYQRAQLLPWLDQAKN